MTSTTNISGSHFVGIGAVFGDYKMNWDDRRALNDGEPEPRNVTVYHWSHEQYDGGGPPEDAAGFIAFLQARLDEIPDEFRPTAKIELGTNSSFGDYYGSLEMTYTRPETADEIAERLARHADTKARKDAADRAQFEALKAKFAD